MEKTKRQSNFELLRIFAIIMIILFHIQLKGSQPQLVADNGYFSQPIIFLRLILFEIGTPLGMIGNGLFILISGYFMNANLHIDIGKASKNLLLQLGFSTVILILAYAVWVTFFKNETFYWDTITIDAFHNIGWFAGYYLFVIVIAKTFLNGYTAKLTQAQFKSLMLTVLAAATLKWSGEVLNNLASGLRTLAIGIFYFLMGGYIARYNPFKKLKTYTFFLAIAATFGIRFLSAYNRVSAAIDYFIKSKSEGSFTPSVQGYSNHEITVVIIAICLFELFRRWNIPYNAVINYIGKSTLMIFFIHYNGFFQSFYRNDNWMEALSNSVLLYCLKWLKWTAIAFAVGLAAYVLYTLLGKLLPRIRSWFIVQEPSE